ncbi:MAG: DoxX family membrane protein [Elusimicrobia bacterium]|nr:DoxX family membrane protein [Elusimicrobiota bacterium]
MKKDDKNPNWPSNQTAVLNAAVVAARVALGAIFMISGFFKLMHPAEEFAAAIEAYRIVHPALILPAAKILPWIEWFVGGYLIAGYCTRAAAIAAGITNCSFFLALASTMSRHINIGDCGCFGDLGPHLKVWQAMILDTSMVAAAIFLIKRRSYPLSLDRWIERV